MKSSLYIAFFILSLTTLCELKAQHYNISHYSNKDGLAQNYCHQIEKDEKGILWIGTKEGGVCTFDGHEFKVLDTSKGLSGNFVNNIEIDKKQKVWVATDMGLSVYDREGKQFESFLEQPIHRMVFDKQEEVWLTDKEGQLYWYNKSRAKLEPFSIANIAVSVFAFDEAQNLLAGTKDNGFHYYIKADDRVVNFQNIEGSVHCLFKEIDGSWLIGTTKGIYHFHPHSKTLKRTKEFDKLRNTDVRHIFRDSHGRVWVGTYGKGVFCFEGDTHFQLTNANGLTDVVTDIEEDNHNGIWFATPDGLYRLNNLNFIYYNHSDGLLSDEVLSLTAGAGNRVYWTTKEGVQWKGNEGDIQTLPFGKTLGDSIGTPQVFGDQHRLWLINNAELYKVFIYTRKIEPAGIEYALDKEKEHFSCGIVYEGKVVLGGIDGIYQLNDGRLAPMSITGSKVPQNVTSMVYDDEGDLFVGTMGNGLYIISKSGSVQHFMPNNGFPSNYVNALKKDAKGNIWIGTSGGSLCKIPAKEKPIRIVSFSEETFSSSNIYALEVDDNGDIWAGTDRGMNKVVILENDYVRVEPYGIDDGFLNLEVSKNTATITKNGLLWFGTKTGLVQINAFEEVFTSIPPKLYFTGIDLYFEKIDLSEYANGINPVTEMPKNLVLPHNKNHLSFRFTGVCMNIPSKVRYQWKLNGFDEEWSPPTNQNVAVYPNLPAGQYTFEVKSLNARGVYENPITFSFEILKPFYFRRSFIFVMFVLISLVLYFAVKERAKQHEKTKKFLRKKVHERTTELERQKVKLATQSKELELKNDELNTIHAKMVSSLQYASRVQKVILDCKIDFKRLFPQSFILHVSRNTVQGNFYWTYMTDEHTHLVFIDCTNQGMPAALMSIIGQSYLQQIVSHNVNLTPAKVLTELNKEVRNVLSHTEDINTINDGMDVAYCRFDRYERRVMFAGARSSLLVLNDGIVEEFKGNFSSIGIDYSDKVSTDFKDYEIELSPTTMLYMFSHSFVNQFNKAGIRYKKSRLKRVISQIGKQSFEQQEETLGNEFRQWKQGSEQMDDATVIGIRYRVSRRG